MMPDRSKASDAILIYLTTLDTDEERLDVIQAIREEMCLYCGTLDRNCPHNAPYPHTKNV